MDNGEHTFLLSGDGWSPYFGRSTPNDIMSTIQRARCGYSGCWYYGNGRWRGQGMRMEQGILLTLRTVGPASSAYSSASQ